MKVKVYQQNILHAESTCERRKRSVEAFQYGDLFEKGENDTWLDETDSETSNNDGKLSSTSNESGSVDDENLLHTENIRNKHMFYVVKIISSIGY